LNWLYLLGIFALVRFYRPRSILPRTTNQEITAEGSLWNGRHRRFTGNATTRIKDWRLRMSKMSGDTARFYRIRASRNRMRARVRELRKEIEARKASRASGVEQPAK